METDKDGSDASNPFSSMPGFWCRKTTLALLNAYEIQNDRLGKDFRYKKYVWQALSHEVKKMTGKDFTAAQCENRWRVLYRSYRKVMTDNNLKSRTRRKDFEYLDTMHRILKAERNINPMLSLSEAGMFACDGKSNVQIEGICSDSEPTRSSSKQLFIISGKPTVNSDSICSESEPTQSSSKKLFIISGKSNVNSDTICTVPEPAPSNNGKQLFIISGKPNVNSDRISSELEPLQSSGKQFFIVSGKSNMNGETISGEHEPAPSSSGKQLFIISGKSGVNSDRISSESEPAPNIRKQLLFSPTESVSSHPEKTKKANQSFLEKMRDDRKLYYEKKLKLDKDRVECSESRKEQLLQLEKVKLQQRERLIACEEEKLKCEKERLLISKEKLKMFGRLVQLQEENNEIVRSINDKFDFLL